MRVSDRYELPRVIVTPWLPRLALTRSRVRTEIARGNWRPLARGAVLTRPEEPTRADWAAVGLALAGPTAALSGWDALRARGLGERWPPTGQVLVLSRRGSNRVIGRARIRRTDRPYHAETIPAEAKLYPLMSAVGVARAIADTALDCRRISPVRAMIGSAVMHRRCTFRELMSELEEAPRNRSALLRRALSETLDGARSAAEAACAEKLQHAPRIPAFELNVPVVDEDGRELYAVDVLWRELRAVLKIDSREYHFSDEDWKGTLARHNQLTRYTLAVTHYPPSTITGRSLGWLDEVADWLAERAAELGLAMPPPGGVIRPPVDRAPPPVIVRARPPL
ncbi:MAG: hypothetical protein ACRDQ1_12825 [Sciscionella sp.]